MHPLDLIKRLYATSSNARFIAHLRLGGVKIGRNVIFRNPRSCRVDVSRPSLVSIGDNVDFNDISNCLRMTGLVRCSELSIMIL